MGQNEIKRIIKEINGTMAIEGMPLTEKNKKDISSVLSGKKTADEIVKKLVKKYQVDVGASHGRA